MWSELSEPWKASLEQAWEAFINGSVPIGAALTDETGAVIARGRSMQFEKSCEPGRIAWSKLSHAEVNALLQISAHDHPNIRGCTLYTTMEPCPLCTGALVMSNVRNLCFAARDGIAGSVSILNATDFMAKKCINVSGPEKRLEVPSVMLHTYFVLEAGRERNDPLIRVFEKDCPEGVQLAAKWFAEGRLEQSHRQKLTIEDLLDEVDSL